MAFKREELVELDAFIEAFKDHMRREAGYGDWELSMLTCDLKDPYNTPYIMQDFLDNRVIDGVEYEVRRCYTNFAVCGLFHLMNVAPFKFYMLIDCSTLENGTVGAYSKARKMYVIR